MLISSSFSCCVGSLFAPPPSSPSAPLPSASAASPTKNPERLRTLREGPCGDVFRRSWLLLGAHFCCRHPVVWALFYVRGGQVNFDGNAARRRDGNVSVGRGRFGGEMGYDIVYMRLEIETRSRRVKANRKSAGRPSTRWHSLRGLLERFDGSSRPWPAQVLYRRGHTAVKAGVAPEIPIVW